LEAENSKDRPLSVSVAQFHPNRTHPRKCLTVSDCVAGEGQRLQMVQY